MTQQRQHRRLFRFGQLLLIGLAVIANASFAEPARMTKTNGWFTNEGEIVESPPWGLNTVDMASAIAVGNDFYLPGKDKGMIRTFVFSARANRVTIVFLDEKLEVVARKEISQVARLKLEVKNSISWQERTVGSGQGGTGESTDMLTVTCDDAGNLVLAIVSRYTIRRYFGLQKKQRKMHERFLFHRLAELPTEVAKRIGVVEGSN